MGEELEFSVNKEWAACEKENPWLAFVPEFAVDSNGQQFMRPRGRSVVYKVVTEDGNNQTYECNDCGSEIAGTTVAHSVWDGPFPGSGSGRVQNETIPYCPKCEDKPDFHGSPISVGPKLY